MSKPNCKHILELLPDYLDGKLSGSPERLLRTHLASCAACRAEAERLRPLLQDLLPLAREEQSDVDWGRFLGNINTRLDERMTPRAGAQGVSPALALTAAAVIIVLFAVWIITDPSAGPDQGDPLLSSDLFDTQEIATLQDIRVEGLTNISGATVEDIPSSSSLQLISEQALLVEDDALLASADAHLVYALGEENVIAAGSTYLSDQQLMETLTESDVTLIAAMLESEDFTNK
ncbi:MAG: zf-HC2 domain-containing protein [Bacteroidetes bacterium]|nr:zf-HC2 domain-containing protein [Bacteroidota bacterium]